MEHTECSRRSWIRLLSQVRRIQDILDQALSVHQTEPDYLFRAACGADMYLHMLAAYVEADLEGRIIEVEDTLISWPRSGLSS
jgi:hypothetical protein